MQATTKASPEALAAALVGLWDDVLHSTDARFPALIEELGLSFTQVKALVRVADGEEPTVGELADLLGLSLPATSRATDGLARRGLVDRREDPADRRARRLALTDEGRAVLDRLAAARREGLEAWAEQLPEAHRARLHAVLTEIEEDRP